MVNLLKQGPAGHREKLCTIGRPILATKRIYILLSCTEIGKKVGLFAELQPGRARKRINAT